MNEYKFTLGYGYAEGKYGVQHAFTIKDGSEATDGLSAELAEKLGFDSADDTDLCWDLLEMTVPQWLVNRIRADAITDYQKANAAHDEVTELCPHCEAEVTMAWNLEEDGYKAFCPHCGKRLMLCDACQHDGPDGKATGECDFCSETDSCKHNPASAADKAPAEPPMILLLDSLCSCCGYFFDAGDEYSGLSAPNNGYNCRHPDQKESEDVDRGSGKSINIGCCYARSCPLGYCPSYRELVKLGVLEANEELNDCDDECATSYICVTDKAALKRLKECGIKSLTE